MNTAFLVLLAGVVIYFVICEIIAKKEPDAKPEEKERAAQQQQLKDQPRQEAGAVQETSQRAHKIESSVVVPFRHNYRVVGVTFDNEDGMSRQDILEAIANAEPPYKYCEVSLDRYEYREETAVAVNVNGDQIGNISKKDIGEVLNDLGRAERIVLNVHGGENGKSYGASVTLVSNGGR